MNKPELRFKADDGSEFPDWRTEKITDIAETYIGLVTTMTEHYVNQGVPLIRNSDIKENKISFNDPIFLDEEFAGKNKQRQHKVGDVITVHTGDVGTSAVIDSALEGSLGFATIVSRIKDRNILSPQYLCDYFNSSICKQIVYDYVTGDGRNNLNMKDFNKLYIPLPCYEEQQKIVELFSALGSVIDSVQKEVNSWEQMKRGVMQKLFSQEVRFKADDGSEFPEWKEATFVDVFDGLNNNVLSRDDLNDNSGAYKNVHYGDVLIKYGSILDLTIDEVPYVNAGINCNKYALLQDGDIVIADTAEDETVGKMVEIRNIGDQKVISGLHTMAWRPKEMFAPMYLGYYMNSSSYHDQLRPYMQGIKVTSVSKSNIVLTEIEIPCIEEQQKIADCLSEFDLVIEKTKQKLEAYKQLKKGLMQRMFV